MQVNKIQKNKVTKKSIVFEFITINIHKSNFHLPHPLPSFTNPWIAASMDGYKNWKPVAFIFAALTVVLFSTSILSSPNAIFSTNDGT